MHSLHMLFPSPNPIIAMMLEPAITAPGVDIFAALSPVASIINEEYKRLVIVVSYNIVSGTSMSCPLATAAAVYVKLFHPTRSPAAIKSALIATAHPMSIVINSDAELAYGFALTNLIGVVGSWLTI